MAMIKINDKRLSNFYLFAALPATFIGVFTMKYFDIPKQFWIINLASIIFLSFVSFLFYKNVFSLKNINSKLILGLAVILLLCTFGNQGLENVNRWVSFGPIQLNIGLIISPLILTFISKETSLLYCSSIFAVVTILFLLQPDASLVTAFSISATIIMIGKLKNNTTIATLVLSVIFSVIYSWYHLDKLQPVSYVEDIMKLINIISPLLFIASILSLLILVLPFFISRSKKDRILISLGIYYVLLVLSSFIGNFPVIVMGYGISPIIGYFIGLIFLIEKNKTSIR